MGRMNVSVNVFNRGIVSDLALARTDIERIALSAEVQTNWMPRTLGPMRLRNGMRYTGTTNDNLFAKSIPFIFSATDLARIELTNLTMRILIDDTPLTRVAVSSTVTNGTFNSDLTGWTDADERWLYVVGRDWVQCRDSPTTSDGDGRQYSARLAHRHCSRSRAVACGVFGRR
jgi:hypothetical protein